MAFSSVFSFSQFLGEGFDCLNSPSLYRIHPYTVYPLFWGLLVIFMGANGGSHGGSMYAPFPKLFALGQHLEQEFKRQTPTFTGMW